MPFSFLHIIIVFLFPFILYVAAGLRSRSAENKAVIVSEVENIVWPAIEAGRVKPVIYKFFPLSDAAEAHRVMESSGHIGKILLFPWLCGWSCVSQWGMIWIKTLCIYVVVNAFLCIIVCNLGTKHVKWIWKVRHYFENAALNLHIKQNHWG